MSTANDRKPGLSNWFLSLRRQPKPKKSTGKKHLQKSCVDLTTIDKDCKSLPASVTNSPKLKNVTFPRDANLLSTTQASSTSTHSDNLTVNRTSPTPNIRYPKISSNQSKCIDEHDNDNMITNTTTSTSNNGKTVTTITKISKTTVINANNKHQQHKPHFHRSGLIFDDNGAPLLNNFDAYQNFANNFRSKLIPNDSKNLNSGHNVVVVNKLPTQNKLFKLNQLERSASDSVDDIDLKENALALTSMSNRPFKSNSLDDDIEYIDSSSSQSDINSCNSLNGQIDDFYFNTIPKIPKNCTTCKSINQQHQQQLNQLKSKSDWNINIKKKVNCRY